MKISQLPNGARFEYEGEEYVKTGPLFATGKGGQRLIPKYAIVRPLDAVTPEKPAAKDAAVSRETVARAVKQFLTECDALVPEERKGELRESGERLLKSLGI